VGANEQQIETASGSASWAVTGGTGLVGRALLSTLVGAKVSALYRSRPGDAAANWVQGDLEDERALAELCRGANVVVHAAGLTAGSERALHRVNTLGAAKMASAARKAGAKRFVLISSQAAREPQLSPYARSKALGEAAVLRGAGDMPVSIIRPPAVLGQDDAAMKPLLGALGKGFLPVPGTKGHRASRLSLITARDLAQTILRVAAEPPRGPIEPATVASFGWQELAHAASTLSGRKVRLVPVPRLLLRTLGAAAGAFRRADLAGGVMSYGKAAEMLHRDWSAEHPLSPGADLADVLSPFIASSAASAPSRSVLRSERPQV
jgi:nucleoside-diphosphate-sugar epimerase